MPQKARSHSYLSQHEASPPGVHERQGKRKVVMASASPAQSEEHKPTVDHGSKHDVTESLATLLPTVNGLRSRANGNGRSKNSVTLGLHGDARSTNSGNTPGKDRPKQHHPEQSRDEFPSPQVIKSIKNTPTEQLTKILIDHILPGKEQSTTKEDRSSRAKNAQRVNRLLKLLGSFFSNKLSKQNESDLSTADIHGKSLRDPRKFGHLHFSDFVHEPSQGHFFSGGPPERLSPFFREDVPRHHDFVPQSQGDFFSTSREKMGRTPVKPFGPFDFPVDTQHHHVGPPEPHEGYETGYFESLNGQPYWNPGPYYDGPYYGEPFGFYSDGGPEPFDMFPESPEVFYGDNVHHLRHVKGTLRSLGTANKKLEKAASEVATVNKSSSSSSPSIRTPKSVPDEFIMAARILHSPKQLQMIESRGNQISATSGQHRVNQQTGRVNSNSFGPSPSQSQLSPMEFTQMLENLQRELSNVRHQYQKCESYRSRIRHALKSHLFGGHNSASSPSSLFNTAASFILGTYILRQFT
ncbi:unnamed protein product [Dicrocoelium dendriticum]|nr:unnamed protein product [Dicrocoelium dendriticum]